MKKPLKIGLLVTFLLGLAGLAIGLYMYNLGQKDLQKVKPDYVLTAVDIQKEFEANESGATEKYVDKILEITGRISSSREEGGRIISIILKTENDLSSVICVFGEGINPADVDISSPVTVRGELSGFLMDVLLNNCVIIK
jgi:hypothetical protein